MAGINGEALTSGRGLFLFRRLGQVPPILCQLPGALR